ncbi:hypothetical protein QO010_003249 [Caulobacter ginsengisoli]|uniref:Uncharacterized protein n=1 Tax=Caulobacter ginsengisoli TaxID=400775 RepID=A0ABU0ITX6_9CAUL|nr:hypothetical protein [Caulobacter ginsengisoli]MDQ0465462.1 hypothetical protein [Caulobacter ginsengisoli]
MQFFDLTPRGDGGPPSLGQLVFNAIPWILVSVLALWALRH